MICYISYVTYHMLCIIRCICSICYATYSPDRVHGRSRTVKIPGSIGTIKEINNGKIRCIPFTDFSFNYPCDIFYDFTGAFYVTAKKGLSFLYFYLATNGT